MLSGVIRLNIWTKFWTVVYIETEDSPSSRSCSNNICNILSHKSYVIVQWILSIVSLIIRIYLITSKTDDTTYIPRCFENFLDVKTYGERLSVIKSYVKKWSQTSNTELLTRCFSLQATGIIELPLTQMEKTVQWGSLKRKNQILNSSILSFRVSEVYMGVF